MAGRPRKRVAPADGGCHGGLYHHWALQTPDGRSAVDGSCKRCGATRVASFKSALSELDGNWKETNNFQVVNRKRDDAVA